MIGVVTTANYHAIAREFFELFKTAWEFVRPEVEYDAVICCGAEPDDIRARLVMVYAPGSLSFDRQHNLQLFSESTDILVRCYDWQLPIYRGLTRFNTNSGSSSNEPATGPIVTKIASERCTWIRIGFDLFAEVEHLLRRGQPSQFARIPTIEIHIAILRAVLVQHQIAFDEIPPVPAGCKFMVCLTHDVDNFGIRNHWFDHTIFGFLYRASIGSLIDLLRGRKSLRQLAQNWAAVLSLPLVYLKVLPDFWSRPEDYLEMERASTFFIIPKRGDPGRTPDGSKSPRRAVRYGLSQVQNSITQILSKGGEIGVHGIDAWRDAVEARKEREQIQALAHSAEVGVRMHWLFFDSESPAKLDQAGFSYDGTIGYNNTIGYRAGTTQAFRPPGVNRLLELPLHIMDTALFYPSYLNLSPKRALKLISVLVENFREFGGLLMINWHDRSIAPERLWGDPYLELIEILESKGAWFCTAGEATRWFRKRRSVDFKTAESWKNRSVADGLPGLQLRSYRDKPPNAGVSEESKIAVFSRNIFPQRR